MAQCYCGTVLMTTPEEPEQDVSSHSTIEGGEVSAFRLAGPRLKIECIVNPALMQFAIGNSPKVIPYFAFCSLQKYFRTQKTYENILHE